MRNEAVGGKRARARVRGISLSRVSSRVCIRRSHQMGESVHGHEEVASHDVASCYWSAPWCSSRLLSRLSSRLADTRYVGSVDRSLNEVRSDVFIPRRTWLSTCGGGQAVVCVIAGREVTLLCCNANSRKFSCPSTVSQSTPENHHFPHAP